MTTKTPWKQRLKIKETATIGIVLIELMKHTTSSCTKLNSEYFNQFLSKREGRFFLKKKA